MHFFFFKYECIIHAASTVFSNFVFQLNIEPNHTTLAGHGYEHDVVMASA